MKINKFLQKCFKKIFQKVFVLFHGRLKEYKETNKCNFKVTKIKNIFLEDNKYDLDNHIYEIPNARVYTDTVEHVAIIKDNIVIPKISYQQIAGELKEEKFNKVFFTGTPRPIKKIDGTMLSLVQGASGNNYFHFLFDIVTKLKLCEQKIALEKIDFFYVPGDHQWQKNIFSLFNINEKKLINSNIYRHVKVKNLIAIDHPWYQKGFVQNEITFLPEWIIFWLREKFLHLSKKFECSDKVFIDRSESIFNHCKLINNNEVIEKLSNFGFKSYQVGKLDFFEQIYLFNNAEIIIGPHGAAFSNIVFSNPNLHLIEIIPEDHPSRKCERICNILKMNYTRIKTPQIIDNKNLLGDIKVSTIEIENALNKFL